MSVIRSAQKVVNALMGGSISKRASAKKSQDGTTGNGEQQPDPSSELIVTEKNTPGKQELNEDWERCMEILCRSLVWHETKGRGYTEERFTVWTNKYKVEFKLLSDHGLGYHNIATHLVEFFKRSSSKEWERKIRRLENKGCQAEWFRNWKELANYHASDRKCMENSRNSIEQGGSPKIEVKRGKLEFSTTKKSVRNVNTSDESSEEVTENESDTSSSSSTSSSEDSDREESSASDSQTSQSEREEKEKKRSKKRSRNPKIKQEGK